MDARAKLLEIERLDEIVVRAGVEPGHQIRAAILGPMFLDDPDGVGVLLLRDW